MRMVSQTEIRNALTPETVRAMQIIYFALFAGVTGFLFVIVFVYMTGPGEAIATEQDVAMVDRLSIIHGFFLIASLVAANLLKKKLLSRERVESIHGPASGEGAASVAVDYIAMIRTVKIITAAVMEAPAFFGLVVCFMAIQTGVMAEHPLYWINTISCFAFIAFMAREFPTKEKIMELFNTELKYLQG